MALFVTSLLTYCCNKLRWSGKHTFEYSFCSSTVLAPFIAPSCTPRIPTVYKISCPSTLSHVLPRSYELKYCCSHNHIPLFPRRLHSPAVLKPSVHSVTLRCKCRISLLPHDCLLSGRKVACIRALPANKCWHASGAAIQKYVRWFRTDGSPLVPRLVMQTAPRHQPQSSSLIKIPLYPLDGACTFR